MLVSPTALNLLSSSIKKTYLLIKREESVFILRLMVRVWAMITGLHLNRGSKRHYKHMKISDRFEISTNSIKSRCYMKVCSLKLINERGAAPEF